MSCGEARWFCKALKAGRWHCYCPYLWRTLFKTKGDFRAGLGHLVTSNLWGEKISLDWQSAYLLAVLYICTLLLGGFLLERGTYGIPLPLSESILLNLSCHSLGVAAPVSVTAESGQCSTSCRWVPMPRQLWLPSAGLHEGPVAHSARHRSSLGFSGHCLSVCLYFQ